MKSKNYQQSVPYWPGTEQLTKPAREVARILGVHPNTIFRWVKSGKLECIRFGTKMMHFTYEQIQEFLNKNREKVHLKL
ncbi:MAG: helix-turn-helix domain-containing protein [Calditrichia bacterium]